MNMSHDGWGWASCRIKNPGFVACEQQRRIPVCLYTQLVQRLCYSFYGKHAKETRLILGCGMSFVIGTEGDY